MASAYLSAGIAFHLLLMIGGEGEKIKSATAYAGYYQTDVYYDKNDVFKYNKCKIENDSDFNMIDNIIKSKINFTNNYKFTGYSDRAVVIYRYNGRRDIFLFDKIEQYPNSIVRKNDMTGTMDYVHVDNILNIIKKVCGKNWDYIH
jgi:hypothetical protein